MTGKHYLKHIMMLILLQVMCSACSNSVDYTPPPGNTDTAITHYSHSKMTIDGQNYDIDLAIFPGGKVKSFSINDHKLYKEDLKPLITDEIKTVIIGTGYSSFVNLTTKALEFIEHLKTRGIQTHIISTNKAVKLFNASSKEGLLACFHLGC